MRLHKTCKTNNDEGDGQLIHVKAQSIECIIITMTNEDQKSLQPISNSFKNNSNKTDPHMWNKGLSKYYNSWHSNNNNNNKIIYKARGGGGERKRERRRERDRETEGQRKKI